MKIVSGRDGGVLLKLDLPMERAFQLAWSGDGKRLAAATTTGHVVIWDSIRGHEVFSADERRDELAWGYRDRAAISSGETRRHALRQFLHFAPDTLGFWEARGKAYAQLGEFNRAYDEFSKGVEPDATLAFSASLCRIMCLLEAGRLDHYREDVRRQIELFKDSPVPSNRTHVAWCCVLAPNDLIRFRPGRGDGEIRD